MHISLYFKPRFKFIIGGLCIITSDERKAQDKHTSIQAYSFQRELFRKTMQSDMRECKLYLIISFIYSKIIKMIET